MPASNVRYEQKAIGRHTLAIGPLRLRRPIRANSCRASATHARRQIAPYRAFEKSEKWGGGPIRARHYRARAKCQQSHVHFVNKVTCSKHTVCCFFPPTTMHPGKPFPQPTPYAHKPPEPSKSRPWDSPSPRWRVRCPSFFVLNSPQPQAGRSGASCARARSCKSDSPRPYARAAYTAMHGTSAGAARTGAGTYTAGQAHARRAGARATGAWGGLGVFTARARRRW